MLFELSNPSDQYTFEAPDLATAAAVAWILGRGAYGAHQLDGDRAAHVPIFLLGGAEEWSRETFGADPADVLNSVLHGILADALDSLLVGDAHARETYRAGLELIDDPAKREAWRDRWHDDRRTSLNNIGAAAWAVAKALRKKETP